MGHLRRSRVRPSSMICCWLQLGFRDWSPSTPQNLAAEDATACSGLLSPSLAHQRSSKEGLLAKPLVGCSAPPGKSTSRKCETHLWVKDTDWQGCICRVCTAQRSHCQPDGPPTINCNPLINYPPPTLGKHRWMCVQQDVMSACVIVMGIEEGREGHHQLRVTSTEGEAGHRWGDCNTYFHIRVSCLSDPFAQFSHDALRGTIATP